MVKIDKKKIKAVIFDFDGVIVESLQMKAQAFAELFRDYPMYIERIKNYHLINGGISRLKKFEYIYNKILNLSLSDKKKYLLEKQFSEIVYSRILNCTYVKGAQNVLKDYAKHVPLFIVSGTPEREIREIIGRLDLFGYFCGIYGSPLEKKLLNTNILRDYGFVADEVLFVGDSIEDYIGATENNIDFIGRIHKGREDLFKNCKVVTLVRDMLELELYISGNYILGGSEL